MSIKKIIALVLCLALVFCVFTGCGSKNDDGETSTPTSENKKSDALMVINGKEISNNDFKYFLNYYKSMLESYVGEITDWSTEISEGYTYRDYVLGGAYDWFMYAAAIRMQAERAGAGMTNEDKEYLEQEWKNTCENNGGEASLLSQLSASGCTKELYMYILESAYLSDKCFVTMYGENAEAITDEECAERSAEDGYIMAKHILVLTDGTYADGTEVHMTEEEKAEAKKKAEGFIAELDNTIPEEVEAKFDELVKEYGEDPGAANYPGGYLFQEGDMVTEFYEAAKGLEIGQYSDAVETSYGYHVILRVPVDYDAMPIAYSDYGYTLRYLIADQMFSANVDSCKERLEITKDIDLESFDLASVFAVG